MDASTAKESTLLKPLLYQEKVMNHIKSSEEKVWKFFSNKKSLTEENEKQKLDLLKNTYRLDKESNVKIFEALEKAKKALNFNLDCFIYQTEDSSAYMNAGIIQLDQEVHIVLSGEIAEKLTEEELSALLGHELSHVIFWETADQSYNITSKIITSIANDYSNNIAYYETARLFNLYTEIFADLGALKVSNSAEVVISLLLKISTGLNKVSVSNYLAQANEIITKEEGGSDGYSHPENYVRALASQWFFEDPKTAESKIDKVVHGKIDIEKIDIFQQSQLEEFTLKFIKILLAPEWFKTNITKQLAADYFKTIKLNTKVEFKEKEIDVFKDFSKSTKEYFCYIIMDFCMADDDLNMVPFSRGFEVAAMLEMDEQFKTIVKKELKLSTKKFNDLEKSWQKDVAKLN